MNQEDFNVSMDLLQQQLVEDRKTIIQDLSENEFKDKIGRKGGHRTAVWGTAQLSDQTKSFPNLTEKEKKDIRKALEANERNFKEKLEVAIESRLVPHTEQMIQEYFEDEPGRAQQAKIILKIKERKDQLRDKGVDIPPEKNKLKNETYPGSNQIKYPGTVNSKEAFQMAKLKDRSKQELNKIALPRDDPIDLQEGKNGNRENLITTYLDPDASKEINTIFPSYSLEQLPTTEADKVQLHPKQIERRENQRGLAKQFPDPNRRQNINTQMDSLKYSKGDKGKSPYSVLNYPGESLPSESDRISTTRPAPEVSNTPGVDGDTGPDI